MNSIAGEWGARMDGEGLRGGNPEELPELDGNGERWVGD